MTGGDIDVSFVRTIFAFATLIALLAVFGFALRYLKNRGLTLPGAGTRRLAIVESLVIDTRRRLVIVRRDQAEHLLLLGGNHDVVIEANLDHNAHPMQTKSGA